MMNARFFGSIDYGSVFLIHFLYRMKRRSYKKFFFNEAMNYFSHKALQTIEAKTTVQYKTIDLKSLILKYILGLYLNKNIYNI